jgi:putative aldouronate transport system substrate-binding protein
MRRIITVVLVCLIAGMGFATGQSESGGGADVTPPGEFPIVNEPLTLSYMLAAQPNVIDHEDNKITEYAEQRSGIDLDLIVVPAPDYNSRVNVMLATASDMPDIIASPGLSLSGLTQWGQQGVLLPITEMVDEWGYYINMMLEAHPSILPAVTAPDGEIYGVPQWQECFHCRPGYKAWINTDWLDAIDADMPTTTAELRDVLERFQAQDVNGNGRADEVLVGAYSGWMRQIEPFILNSFVLWYEENYADGLYLDDGTIRAAYAEPEYRDALRYMADLVEDGLMSPESFTQDATQYTQFLSQEPPAAAVYAGFSPLVPTALQESYDYLLPLEGPDGVRWSSNRPFLPIRPATAIIASTTDHPEAAFRFLDMFFDPEYTLWSRYGEPGVDWRPAESGELSVLGEQALITVVNDVWGEPHNAHWHGNAPYWNDGEIQDHSTHDLFKADEDGNVPIGSPMIESSMAYNEYIPPDSMVVPPFAINIDGVEEYNEIKTTIDTYVQEQRARFIVGDLDLESEWETYLRELENIGLSRMLEIMQASYER